MSRKTIILFLLLILILVIISLLDVLLGSVHIPVSDVINVIAGKGSATPEWDIIIRDFRIPKLVTALFAGMALSVSGLQMQTVFRNPLAGPYVLGISSGASLGVAILILGFSSIYKTGYVTYVGNLSIALAAWLGAAGVLALVLAVSVKIRDIMTLLILGMLFAGAVSAIVSILQYFGTESMLKSFVVWTMGSLAALSSGDLIIFVPCICIGLIISVLLSKKMNILLLGENYARTLGLNIRRTRWMIFISTSILAGTVTAFCGPIGFIGTAIPHLSRMVFRTSNHWILNFSCMLIGAIVLVLGDIISQVPGTNIRLPIDAVTALLGVPVIIWVVFKNFKFSSFS